MARIVVACLILAIGAGCKDKPKRHSHDDAAVAESPRDAVPAADAGVWPEIAKLPSIAPVRVIAIPTKQDLPRFTTGGPVLMGDLALLSSSQFGFAAVDFRRGQLVWTKPAGSHVAPPVVVDGNAVLIGSCLNPPAVPDTETLLGCMRVVSPTGIDQAYIAIRGKAVAAFDGAAGDQRVWAAHRGTAGEIVWRRGDQAVSIDMLSGIAKSAPAEDPPLSVTYKDRHWDIRRTEDGFIDATGKPSWRTEFPYSRLIGAVYIPGQSPLVRATSATMHAGEHEILVFDIDATGSLHGQVSLSPVPGIAVTAHAINTVGDAALAVRLDTSLQRDYIAGFAANASLIWTYALPQVPRPDPIGIAMAPDAVVVFHDGDTVTVLPELSAPPTAPGAVREPLENPTP
jgi:hypothetical protein